MRLICPNCDAQYEVPDNVIPPEGRDVQCSSCGTTWFQSAAAQHTDDDLTELQDVSTENNHETSADATPPRKELDEGVKSILQEEAEISQQIRQAEQEVMDARSDIGVDDTDRADARLRARDSREATAKDEGALAEEASADTMGTTAAAAIATGAAASTPRKELLPDVEELNSSLRPAAGDLAETSKATVDYDPPRKKRSGFKSGFRLIILLAVLAALLYVFAEPIKSAVPALEAPITKYVDLVDQGRAWLDTQVRGLLTNLDEASSEASSNPDAGSVADTRTDEPPATQEQSQDQPTDQ